MFNLKVYTMKRQRFFEGLGLKVYVTLAICMALLLNVQFLNAQSSTINVKGVVNDAMGPVIGASVVEKGNATNGTITVNVGNDTGGSAFHHDGSANDRLVGIVHNYSRNGNRVLCENICRNQHQK